MTINKNIDIIIISDVQNIITVYKYKYIKMFIILVFNYFIKINVQF